MPTSTRPETQKVFDYTSLDAETSQFVQQQTGEIQVLMKRTAQGIVEVGQKLIEVKARLEYGRFGAWLATEFAWDVRTARRFMSVAESLGDRWDNLSELNFAPSALYELAAPSTPEAARTEALTRAKTGELITYTAAKAIKKKYASTSTKLNSVVKSKPKPEPEPALQSQLTTILVPLSQSGSKLEIVAIRTLAQTSALETATRLVAHIPQVRS